jgi:short-subunit dehydrogenase
MPTFHNAFITGASSGIGAELARLLAATGTRVVLAARREPELRALRETIVSAGGAADVCVLDVTKSADVAAAVTHWDAATGGLDLVVANAGISVLRRAHKLEWKDVAPVLDVNVTGALATLVAALGPMVQRVRGTLCGVSCLAGMRGLPMSAAYSASKAALSTFLESLRVDLIGRGVHVVDVRPGFVATALTEGARFTMPFLMNVQDAARVTLRGIERGDPVVAFPWPTAMTMSAASSVPDALYRGLLRLGTLPGRRAHGR